MKLFAVLAISNAFSNAEKLKCWTCENGSMDECQRLGKFKTCRDNSSCQVEWRSRYGATSKVKMGCKEWIQILSTLYGLKPYHMVYINPGHSWG